ncbi:MAG: hypothetical protein CM1200mP13_11380 [Candidatus Pelagibacterales bacterium]|nr:MAG: hypothetical protein CM1200mP13_11380 [Pelagibacterales bacterium]
MGIGGAIMNVPILRYFGFPINKAIGSAASLDLYFKIWCNWFFNFGSFLKANLP